MVTRIRSNPLHKKEKFEGVTIGNEWAGEDNRHEDLLSHLKRIVEDTDEDGKAMIALHEDRFKEVVTALRTAKSVGNRLNKEDTINDDTLDSLRLALYYFRYEDK